MSATRRAIRTLRATCGPSAAAALALAVAASAAQAGPVTVSQDLPFATIAPFGTFTPGSAGTAGWSSPWPFTDASQITSIEFSFASTDLDFTDPARFPANDGGGTPGVELGFVDESTATRRGVSSVSAAAPTVTLTSINGTIYAALVASLLDGSVEFSLGAFVNYPNAATPFSAPLVLDGPSTLTVRVNGRVPDAVVPEPASLALAGLALAAAAGATRRRAARVVG